jgi:tellurite resistance protein
MSYAWKSHTEKDLSLEMQRVSKEIQLEYGKKIQKAQMSMDLNELQTIAIEMKQRIEEMLESYRAAAGAISHGELAPAVPPRPDETVEAPATKGRPLASVSVIGGDPKNQPPSSPAAAPEGQPEDVHLLMKREVNSSTNQVILPTPPKGMPAAFIPKWQEDSADGDEVLSTRRADQSKVPTGRIRKIDDEDDDIVQDMEAAPSTGGTINLPPAGILASGKAAAGGRWENEETDPAGVASESDGFEIPPIVQSRDRMKAAASDVATYAASAIANRWSDSTGSNLQSTSEVDGAGDIAGVAEASNNDYTSESHLSQSNDETSRQEFQDGDTDESFSPSLARNIDHQAEFVPAYVVVHEADEDDEAEDDDDEADEAAEDDDEVNDEGEDEDHDGEEGSESTEEVAAPVNRQEKYKDFYAKNPTSLDLDIIVYDGDRDVIQGLLEEPEFFEIWDSIQSRGETYDARRDLLKSALRLTKAMAPLVHRIGQKCKDYLGISADIEFYVTQDAQFNAMVYPPQKGRIYIVLTSSLLESFTETELEFVVGHELGHFLFNHFDFPVAHILHEGGGTLTPLQAMKLYSWKRNAEVSADRIGLMVCRDFMAVGRAFFKLSSGISGDSLTFQLNEYVDQFKDLQAEVESDLVGPEDWYSTHPFSPLRIKALQIYESSESFYTATGRNGGTITEAEMEQQIKAFMSIMEPAYLNDDSDGAAEIQQFVFLAGYAIAAANGKIEEAEVNALGSLIPEAVFNACMQEVGEYVDPEGGFDMDALMTKVAELSEVVNVRLPVIGKLNMIKDLAIITYSDGNVDAAEMDVLYGICHFLGIYGEFADSVLHDAGKGMD